MLDNCDAVYYWSAGYSVEAKDIKRDELKCFSLVLASALTLKVLVTTIDAQWEGM